MHKDKIDIMYDMLCHNQDKNDARFDKIDEKLDRVVSLVYKFVGGLILSAFFIPIIIKFIG